MKTFLSVFVIFFSGISAVWAQDYVGTIKKMDGDVCVVRGDQISKTTVGAHVFAGDVIRTGKNGAVGIIFLEGTRVSLGGVSEIEVNDFVFQPCKQEYAFDAFLKKGTAVYSSGKLGKLAPEKIKFRTPKTIVGVRGTKFMVNVK